jgi:hypothetical protein
VEDRGDLDPAPPSRRAAAPAATAAEAGLGGPGPALATLLGVIPKARRQGLRLLLITPDTIVRWHRDIVRRRWAARSVRGRTGRPPARPNIRAPIRRLAHENPNSGYRRIHGKLAGLGVKVAASTVWEILKASGIDPARRQTGLTGFQFLRSQAVAAGESSPQPNVPDTCPGRTPESTFLLVRGVYSNPLRSRKRGLEVVGYLAAAECAPKSAASDVGKPGQSTAGSGL